jgi:hypothetical protein
MMPLGCRLGVGSSSEPSFPDTSGVGVGVGSRVGMSLPLISASKSGKLRIQPLRFGELSLHDKVRAYSLILRIQDPFNKTRRYKLTRKKLLRGKHGPFLR